MASGDAIFECSVIGYPLAQISWKRNNKKLSDNNKKFRIVHGSNISFLRVTDAVAGGHGGVGLGGGGGSSNKMNITCVAENGYGHDHVTSTLSVLPERERPKSFPLVHISNPKSVEPNAMFRIECNITSPIEPVVVEWFQANRPVRFDNPKYFTNWTRDRENSNERTNSIGTVNVCVLF